MPSHFQVYVGNFNRIRMGELIDFHIMQERLARARPSLVVQPLTGYAYSEADDRTPTVSPPVSTNDTPS